MAAITITITESELKLVEGIPSSILLETNIPATIFYTIDGSDPTLSSDIAIGPIQLPTNKNTITLKVFATDGSITSPIITHLFGPNTSSLRQPRDKVSGINFFTKSHFPFGTRGPSPAVNGIYGNTAGTVVNAPLKPKISDGYDGTGTGTPAGYTNEPLLDYTLIFSETNSIGKRGVGIGTIPTAVTTVKDNSALNEQDQYSKTTDKLFNPKALVIFQDSGEEQPEDIPIVNRPHFSLEGPHVRDGALMNTSETQPTTGSALRQHFNSADNTITYYYYDNRSGRWIISKVPFTPKNENIGNYSSIVFPSRKSGTGFVFKWIPGIRRNLY